jgi:hypothetical protein
MTNAFMHVRSQETFSCGRWHGQVVRNNFYPKFLYFYAENIMNINVSRSRLASLVVTLVVVSSALAASPGALLPNQTEAAPLSLTIAQMNAAPDALLQIDSNRNAVVSRIVQSWRSEIPAAQIRAFQNSLLGLAPINCSSPTYRVRSMACWKSSPLTKKSVLAKKHPNCAAGIGCE